jgi:hypothetical protein
MNAPKNIIKKGLFANKNEFIFAKTRRPYEGPYVSLFGKVYFSGAILTPLSKRIIKSSSPENSKPDDNTIQNLSNEINNNLNQLGQIPPNISQFIRGINPDTPDLSNYDENTRSLILDTKDLNDALSLYLRSAIDRIFYDRLIPSNIFEIKTYQDIPSHLPKPTEKEYSIGYIKRYFTKKINEPYGSIIEISEKTYNKIISQKSEYNYALYKAIEIKWKLTSSEKFLDETKSINYKTISQNNKEMLGLVNLLQSNLSQFSRTTQ